MKKRLVILIIVFVVMILGTSYAWLNYNFESSDSKVITGNIYMLLENGEDTINLVNVFPESKEKARSKDNNYVSFKIYGLNESSDNVHYEISLLEGDTENDLERFNAKDLVFDLVEIGDNDEETYLLDAVSFDTINNRKIWIDTIRKNTNSEVEKEYRLRMWVSDSILISDSDANRDYYATGEHAFNKHYASVKVMVYADINEKSLPSSTTTRDSYVENGKSYFITKLSNDYLLEEEGNLLANDDIVTLEITNPENKLYFSYIDSKGNEDYNQNTSLVLTYDYNRNETVNIKVFTESRNDSNVNTTLHFKVTKNGTIVQEYNKQINVIGNNYCLNNGFTNLKDCILVTENLSKNVATAKAYITSKGSPNVNTTAPTYTYVEEQVANQTYTGKTGYPNWSSGESYVFDTETGTFTLKQADGVTDASTYVPLSNDLIGKYTCGTSNNEYYGCAAIFKVTSVNVDTGKVTGTKIVYRVASSLDSEQGLYKVQDMDGDSYVFRGDVTNNNVYFGGYYWKILRINGDDSIRLIFNGNALSSDGNKTAADATGMSISEESEVGSIYNYNQLQGGPTYEGYMVTESENYWTTTTLSNFSAFVENTSYYFADDFETFTDSDGNRKFRLKGNVYQSKAKDLTQAQVDAQHYTCAGTNSDLVCTRLFKISSIYNNTTLRGNIISYSPNYVANSSLTKADVELNSRDSNAKTRLDTWYHDKFMNSENNNKAVTSYLIDEPFCNDRSITRTSNYNSGYLLTTHSYYAAKTRLMDTASPNKFATLMCNKNDAFSVTETTKANGKLTYPVGLISADEVALAGGKYDTKNSNYYLRTNGNYWTMSPAYYVSTNINASVWRVNATGALVVNGVSASSALRPVINLKKTTLISSDIPGDGSVAHPYIID